MYAVTRQWAERQGHAGKELKDVLLDGWRTQLRWEYYHARPESDEDWRWVSRAITAIKALCGRWKDEPCA